MRDVMFEIPSRDDIKKCIITKECIEDNVNPEVVLREEKDLEQAEAHSEPA